MTHDSDNPRPEEAPTVIPDSAPQPPPESSEDATIPPEHHSGRGVSPKTLAGHADTIAPESQPLGYQHSAGPSLLAEGYEILDELGRGGMGVVYKARDTELNRIVALKMILAGAHASPETLARFKTEAEAVAQLQHRGIVQVFDVGQVDGQPYCALEYVQGGALDQLMARAEMSTMDAVAIVEELAHAMSAAHQAGIVHRDLKPANILMDFQGSGSSLHAGKLTHRPKITDFGLAKKVEQDSQHTQTGAIMGTPSYMAPEQARGVKRIGPAADVYSLGAILYHLITKRPPFSGDSPIDTIMHVIDEPPVSPRTINEGVDRDLDTIILKCLEKDPAARYASAEHLAQDLHRYQLKLPIEARPVSGVERFAKWVQRKPLVAGMIAVSLIALIGLIVGGLLVNRELSAAYDDVQREHEVATAALEAEQKAVSAMTTALDRAKTSEAQSRRRLIQNYVNNALQSTARRDPLDALPWLSRAIALEPVEARRRVLQLRFNLALQEAPSAYRTWVLPAIPTQCRFSRDGSRIAAHFGGDRHIRVWGIEDSELLAEMEAGGPIQAYEIDDEFQSAIVVFGQANETGFTNEVVQWFDIESGEWNGPELAIRADDGRNLTHRISPERGWVARRADTGHSIELVDLRSHAVVDSLPFRGEIDYYHMERDGTHLAAIVEDRFVLIDLDRRETVMRQQVAAADGDYASRFQFVDGHVILATDRIRVYRVSDGRLTGNFPRTDSHGPLEFAFSSRDGGLAVAHRNGTVETFAGEGQRINQMHLHTRIVHMQYTSDGETLYVATPVELLRFDRKSGVDSGSAIPATIRPIQSVAVSPDGRHVAMACGSGVFTGQGCLRIWALGQQAHFVSVNSERGKTSGIHPSPDGERLLLTSSEESGIVGLRITDRSNPQVMWRMPTAEEPWPDVRCVAWNPTRRQVAIGLEDGRVVLVDSESGEHSASIVLPYPSTCVFDERGSLLAISYGQDGELAAVATSEDGTVKCEGLVHRRRVVAMGFDKASESLVTTSEDLSVRVFDIGLSRQVQKRATGLALKATSFAPASGTVVMAGARLGAVPGRIRLLDMATLEDRFDPLDLNSAIHRTALSADESLIAACDDIGTVRIFNAHDGTAACANLEHPDRVLSAEFSHDGQILLTICRDKTARLFDVRTGLPLTSPVTVDEGVEAGHFLAASHDLVLRSAERAVIWKVQETPYSSQEAEEVSRFLTARTMSSNDTVMQLPQDELTSALARVRAIGSEGASSSTKPDNPNP